jgi:hypothetical protein
VSSIPGNSLSSLPYVMGTNATVGVVPSYGSPSSLLFFMKVGSDQFCGGSALATDPCGTNNIGMKYLRLTIMLNSDVITSDSLQMPLGLKYTANDGSGAFKSDYFECFTPGYCDLAGQNTYQIIGRDTTSSAFGVASFECGDAGTLSADVLSNCAILGGRSG